MTIRIGSRASCLAMEQAKIVAKLLHTHNGEITTELVPLQTSGDLLKDKPIDSSGGKGLFTREIDAALLERRIDMAVHSLKDMPAFLPDGLVIAAFCAAEDPLDALVLASGVTDIGEVKSIGCSSKRRSVQLAQLYSEIPCIPVRGNVPTRLSKLDAGEYGALVLALAGLKRLGLENRVSKIFTLEEMLPAAGQGTLAVVTRDEGEAFTLACKIDDPALRRRSLAERSFTRALEGGCGIPVAAFASQQDEELTLYGGYSSDFPTETGFIRQSISSKQPENNNNKETIEETERLGERLAFRMLAEAARRKGKLGKVILLGAGPGGVGLLTFQGEDELSRADVVVFDKLAGPATLAKIPERAQKIYAGKSHGLHELSQEQINALLVKKAASGFTVVRLKGGDPMLFGRGSEEALCLSDAGIPCEIVPGVPSAIAVPAAAGIPLTHRGIASTLHIITAHGADAASSINFPLLAKQSTSGGTLVFMMGFSKIDHICNSLIDAGLSPDTPSAMVSSGTMANEKTVCATLKTIAKEAKEAGLKAPAIIVVGDTCRLAQVLSLREKKPFAGLRIAVTRPRNVPGINRLSKMFARQGAEVIDLPTIKIIPVKEAPLLTEVFATLQLDTTRPAKTWLAFTSVHGVEAFFTKLSEYGAAHKGFDIRSLAACKFAAVGQATCAALSVRGITTDLVPATFSGAALGTALAKTAAQDETVVIPRSSIGGKELPEALALAGITCIDIPMYDTLPETGYENPQYRARLVEGLDCAAFTSPSAVEAFLTTFGCTEVTALCIGEVTAAPARKAGMNVIVPAHESLEGMVKALAAHYR